MLVVIFTTVLAALSAWLGWRRRIRSGLIAAVLLPLIIGLVAAAVIRLPTTAGGPWVFVLSFVFLASTSLVSFGLALCLRRLIFRD